MKPNFRLSKPPTELFISPYGRSSTSSGDGGPSDSSASSLTSPTSFEPRRTDSQTPLLPPTPTQLEKGAAESYPFPSRYHHDHRTLLARLRAMVGQVGGGGLYRRLCYFVTVLSILGILLTRSQPSVSRVNPLQSGRKELTAQALPPKQVAYAPGRDSRYASGSTAAASHESTSKFRFPSIPLPFLGSGRHKSGLPLVPAGSSGSQRLSSSSREAELASEPLPVEASLQERLEAWKNAPGGRGDIEGEVEHGTFVQWNLEVGTDSFTSREKDADYLSNVRAYHTSTTRT